MALVSDRLFNIIPINSVIIIIISFKIFGGVAGIGIRYKRDAFFLVK